MPLYLLTTRLSCDTNDTFPQDWEGILVEMSRKPAGIGRLLLVALVSFISFSAFLVLAPIVAYSRTIEVLDAGSFEGFGIAGVYPNFTSTDEVSYGSITYGLFRVGVAPSFAHSYSLPYYDRQNQRNSTLTIIYRTVPTPDLAISSASPLIELENIELGRNESTIGGLTLSIRIRNISSLQLTLGARVNYVIPQLFEGSLIAPYATTSYEMTVWPPVEPQSGQHCQVVIIAHSDGAYGPYTHYWVNETVQK